MPGSPPTELLERIYHSLYRIRATELKIEDVYSSDAIKSPVHLSIGQEAASVGVCEALAPQDIVFATYRGHGAYLAKGGDLNKFVAELYGKTDGSARGKAGSMHTIDLSVGFMGTSAIVATTIPHAVGYAWAARQRHPDTAVVCFFGDGAIEEGVFHESINYAALKSLPVLFACENNSYAIYTPTEKRVKEPNYVERARSYGVEAARIEGGDVLALHNAVQAWRGDPGSQPAGPLFLEIETDRWRDHVGPGEDTHLGHRTAADVEALKTRDQLARIRSMLSDATAAAIEVRIERDVEAAFTAADASAYPGPEELVQHVFR